MKNKNDKIFILLFIMLICLVMSWIVEAGVFNSGSFSSVGYYRAGIFDLFALVLSAFYYKRYELFYLFLIGGCYGVLTQTKIYRKLVDKTSALIKGKEPVVMALITLLMGAYISISNNLLVLLFLSPFIVSVFLRNGYDKITALSAGFGGIFIGYLGLTFGLGESQYLYESTGVDILDWMWVKVVLFIAAYVLFTLFAILHMRKNNEVDETEDDIFCPAPLDETKLKKRQKVKLWPIILVMAIVLVNVLIGYISWFDSFDISFFSELHTNFASAFTIADVPIFYSLLGSYFTGFGEWDSLMFAMFFLLVGVIVIALISKMKVDDFVKYFGRGMRKISKVAFIFGLSYVLVFLATSFPWQNTMLNFLFGDGTFNILLLLIIAIIAQIFIGDPSYSAYTFAPYLTVAYTGSIVASIILWRLGTGIALVAGPTSFILLSALTYLNVSYKDWLKYIWKFVLTFVIVSLLVMAIVLYV